MQSRGFTIIELVMSIFILSAAIVGVYGAFSVMLVLTSDATDRLTGAYLAQEGMEIMRNIRDTNWLKIESEPFGTRTWLDGIKDSDINCVLGCEADYTTGTGKILPFVIRQWVGEEDQAGGQFLKQNATSGFYNYTSGTDTKFKRKITITCLPNNDCSTDYIIKVVVKVYWYKKVSILNPITIQDSITTEETLYNWYTITE